MIVAYSVPMVRCHVHLFNKASRVAAEMDKRLVSTGAGGTIISALCCFTPLLAVLLSWPGLATAIGYLDLVLLPSLFILVILFFH